MKVARNTSHVLRHDWLKLTDENGAVQISLMVHRNEIHLVATIDGKTVYEYVTPRQLALALMKLDTDPNKKP